MSLLAWIYGIAVALRNYLYDKGILDAHDLGARAISVGNITVGGTGKTPLVAYVARELAAIGEKVCILTRGYGRDDERRRVLVSDGENISADAATGGDEPVELASKLLGKAIVIADGDRVGAADWARRKFSATAFVLDDGFQHRRVRRDIDIVCIDATAPFGGDKMLPAGRLREPVGNLNRADVVVITRVEQVDDISDLRSQISDIAPEVPVFECGTRLVELKSISAEMQRGRDEVVASDRLEASMHQEKYFAFCALGNPENFFSLLRKSGVDVAGIRAFPDHHRYACRDVEEIELAARGNAAEGLITTAKDAVKLDQLHFTLPCYVAEIEIELDNPAAFASIALPTR